MISGDSYMDHINFNMCMKVEQREISQLEKSSYVVKYYLIKIPKQLIKSKS